MAAANTIPRLEDLLATMSSKIDTLSSAQNARFDALSSAQNAKLDALSSAQNAKLDAQDSKLRMLMWMIGAAVAVIGILIRLLS